MHKLTCFGLLQRTQSVQSSYGQMVDSVAVQCISHSHEQHRQQQHSVPVLLTASVYHVVTNNVIRQLNLMCVTMHDMWQYQASNVNEGNIWLDPIKSPKSCNVCHSNPHAVVARLANLPDPLVNLVVALLPYLQILHPQTTGAEHGYLHSHMFCETSCKYGSAIHACPAVFCSCDYHSC